MGAFINQGGALLTARPDWSLHRITPDILSGHYGMQRVCEKLKFRLKLAVGGPVVKAELFLDG